MKAYERISRLKLKQDFESGGINAPDISTFNEALKVRQLIRSTSKDNSHFINFLQSDLLKYEPSVIFQKHNFKCHNSFVNDSVKGIAKLGLSMIAEILDSNDESRLNRDYYDLIASEKIMNLVKRITNNRIVWLLVDKVVTKLGITYVGQLINEYKFPSNDELRADINSIVHCGGSVLSILTNRKQISYGITFRESFFLDTNVSVKEYQLTTKGIKKCLFKLSTLAKSDLDFVGLKNILHPKERELAFFNLHNVTLNNDKLFGMKLVESPECIMCKVTQTNTHIFEECVNAVAAYNALSRCKDRICPTSINYKNVMSLVNRMLFLNRNRAISSDLFCVAINNRIDDIEKIMKYRDKKRELDAINKLVLSTCRKRYIII